MAMSIKPEKVMPVLDAVVDRYSPKAKIFLYIDNKKVTNGAMIVPSVVENAPTVIVRGPENHRYTMVMSDPDAPNPSEPVMKEYVHWIVTNIAGGARASEGEVVLPYVAPCPTIGIHCYIFTLFHQTKSSRHVEPPPSRFRFNTRAFARNFNFGKPVATTYFNSQKEPACKKQRLN